uniref:Uncharacterized protein n=1 Tax=Arundo donax TaxID=35708 RepID=A0A0A8XZA4_ARUDO
MSRMSTAGSAFFVLLCALHSSRALLVPLMVFR